MPKEEARPRGPTEKVFTVEAASALEMQLEELRCASCNRVLLLYAIVDGAVVVRCKRCKSLNALDIRSDVDYNSRKVE